MGLFDIFKKKASPISFEITEATPPMYDPWAETGLPVNDNYAIAAFVLRSENGAKVGNVADDYPRKFNYEHNISDPVKYHKQVIRDGYLVEAPPVVALEHLRLEQLKTILANANLPTKGKKAELVKRIMESVDLNTLQLETYYVPSEKGLEHLRKYEYLFEIKKYDISLDEFNAAKAKYSPHLKVNDVIWRALNDKFNRHNVGKDYGLARNTLLNMAKLLESESRNVDALLYYVRVLYYDTSGLSNGNFLNDDITLAPGIVEKIHKLKDHYDPQIIERCYDRHKLPHHYIKRADFERLVFDIFEDKTIEIKNYIK